MYRSSSPFRKYFLLALALMPFIPGCSGCCDKDAQQTFQYTLTADEKAYIPYVQGDNFRMMHSTNTVTEFLQVSAPVSEITTVELDDCDPRSENEVYKVSFQGDQPVIDIGIDVYAAGYVNQEPAVLTIRIANEPFSVSLDGGVECSVNQNYVQCLDSIEIQGVWYYDVYQLGLGQPDIFVTKPNRVWYNKTVGLLKFSLTDGQFWELLP